MLEFVSEANASMLTPEVAQILGPWVLHNIPYMFEKLTSNLEPESRNTFLDSAFMKIFAPSSDSCELYLKLRGISSPGALRAFVSLAYNDLQRALPYIQKFPPDRQRDLLRDAYGASIDRSITRLEPLDSIIKSLDSVPAEISPQVSLDVVRQLTFANPRMALQFLEQRGGNNSEMWGIFFEHANLTPDELNAWLETKRTSGLDRAVYSAAAARIIDQFAREDISSAKEAIEAMPIREVKTACINSFVKAWGAVDPMSALDYVKQLPAGSDRDKAIEALLPKLSFAQKAQGELLSLTSSDAAREALGKTLSAAPR
jgi:hypothetical protein